MASDRKKTSSQPNQKLQLRIIGGLWRGRNLAFPDVDGLRPSGSRIRETLFNWIAPSLPGARCLDLYAGSGALGFEALSRGAVYCQLIEQNKSAAMHLKENANKLQTNSAEIVCGDTLSHLKSQPTQGFDVIFIDPPFASNLWKETEKLLNQNNWLNDNAQIYVETPLQLPNQGFTWSLIKQKKAGNIVYSLYQND